MWQLRYEGGILEFTDYILFSNDISQKQKKKEVHGVPQSQNAADLRYQEEEQTIRTTYNLAPRL